MARRSVDNSVPIICISVLPSATLAMRLAGCSYDAIIAKPFDLDVVAEPMRRILTDPSSCACDT